MTTKYLTGVYPGGYALSGAYKALVIEPTAFVGGAGVTCGAKAAVSNYGTVEAGYGQATGVDLAAGGSVQNGSGAAPNVFIEGFVGVTLASGGKVTNGAADDTASRIVGVNGGVIAGGLAATVVNFATIQGVRGLGVELGAGGRLTNGSADDTAALISGVQVGVLSQGGAATIVNYGAIRSVLSDGVDLSAGGAITNGSAADTTALIAGRVGVAGSSAPLSIANFGTVRGASAGIALRAGGALTNGSAADAAAQISASVGTAVESAGADVANFGTILGGAAGVSLSDGTLTNGSSGDAAALVEGRVGVATSATGSATVINFGTIIGSGGVAVQLFSSADVLVAEAGCGFGGSVTGGGGTLILDSGVGALTHLADGGVTVSGSMATTKFSDFTTVEIGVKGQFTVSGQAGVAAGDRLIDAGSLTFQGGAKTLVNSGLIEVDAGAVLTLRGLIDNEGTVAVNGGSLNAFRAVTGAGVVTIDGGRANFVRAFDEAVAFTGTSGILRLAQAQGYTASVSGFSTGGGTSLDLLDIHFVDAAEATYSGTAAGGVLTVTDGTRTAQINLTGDYLSAVFTAATDDFGGTVVTASLAGAARTPAGPGAPAGPGTPHALLAAMAGLGPRAGAAVHDLGAPPLRAPLLARPHALVG